MRKKKNLVPRLGAVSERFAETPEDVKTRAGLKPLWVELGCGMGSFAALTAKANPGIFFVGFERVREAIVVAAERCCELNAAFVCRDVDELETWFEPKSIECIFIHFCDPWHKKRHAKRRLTYRLFLQKYEKLLTDEGELVFKTDNSPLFEFSLEELSTAGWELISVSRDWHSDPGRNPNEPMTEYETKFFSRGQAINRLTAKPRRV